MTNPNAAQRKRFNPAAFAPSISPFFGLLPPELWDRTKDFFTYSADFIPLAAGGTLTVDIAIQADSDFAVVAGVRVVTDVADVVFFANVPQTVSILDASSGRQFQDRAVHIDNLFGTAQLPALWPMTKLIRANATLSTTLTNLDPANARNVRISYLGFKIFTGF